MMLVLVMFMFGAGLVLAGYFGLTKLPGYLAQRKLEARLDEVTAPIEAQPAEGAALIKGRYEGPLPAFDRFVAGTARGSAIGTWVEQSGVKMSVSGLMLVSPGSSSC